METNDNTQNNAGDENVYVAPDSSSSAAAPKKNKLFAVLVPVVVVLGILFLLAGMFVPIVGRNVRPAADRAQCLNYQRQIALAMYNYETAHGHFPPAYIADENGKPMHSWRVLILPYIEENELYERYSMDEPWDGPNNSKLHDEIVQVYRCPSSRSADHCSDYVVITGEGTGFDRDQTVSYDDLSDGTAQTVLVTEFAGSDFHWMKPQDITLDQFIGITVDAPISNHRGVRNVALFDGSTHAIDFDTSPEQLRRIALVNDGEEVTLFD